MLPTAVQFNSICQASLVAAGQFAAVYIDSTEHLFKATFDATRQLVDGDNAPCDLAFGLTGWSNVYQDNVQKMLAIANTYWESTTQARDELTQLIEEQVTTVNHSAMQNMQALTNARLLRDHMEQARECDSSLVATA